MTTRLGKDKTGVQQCYIRVVSARKSSASARTLSRSWPIPLANLPIAPRQAKQKLALTRGSLEGLDAHQHRRCPPRWVMNTGSSEIRVFSKTRVKSCRKSDTGMMDGTLAIRNASSGKFKRTTGGQRGRGEMSKASPGFRRPKNDLDRVSLAAPSRSAGLVAYDSPPQAVEGRLSRSMNRLRSPRCLCDVTPVDCSPRRSCCWLP